VVRVGVDAVTVGAAAAVVTGGGARAVCVTGGVGVTGSGDRALAVGEIAAACGGRRRAGRCGFAPAFPGRAGVEVLAGARPDVTDSGSPASPTLVAASWLADHATVAVAAMPSSAAATHSNVRRFTGASSYSASG
jgi:hypothetical protein